MRGRIPGSDRALAPDLKPCQPGVDVTDVVPVHWRAPGTDPGDDPRPDRRPDPRPDPGSNPAAGWFPDPLAPGRLRFWDGQGWSAHVSAVETDPPSAAAISWWSTLAMLTAPAAEGPVREAPPVEASAPLALEPPPGAFTGYASDPLVVAFGAEAVHAHRAAAAAAPAPAPAPRPRRRLVPLVAAAAFVAVAAAAVAGAGVLRSDDQRPDVATTVTERDTAAGYALRYPEAWKIQQVDPGTGVRFTIAAPGAPTTETNTVSVNVGPTSAELPELHTLADQLTEKLRVDLPDIELVSASEAHLAGAPALHFTFRDPDASPPTTIEQYVGRTTAGRPLTITITIREPRTAPSGAELRDFVKAVTPA